MMDLSGIAQAISIWALPLVFAVTLHEAAHGYAALAMGDDTARRLGRLSLNPLRHIDPVGTVLLPAVLLLVGGMMFGWAKPVPVNFSKLRNPRLGMVAVAAAGPGTNILMAITAIIFMGWVEMLPKDGVDWARLNLANAIYINLLLAVFNMLPIPPLDGGRVAVGLLPRPLAFRLARLENVGLMLILAALFLLPMIGRQIGLDLDVFEWIVQAPVAWLLELLVRIFAV